MTCTKSQTACNDCAAASRGDCWEFTAGCRSCCARAASRMPQARKQRSGDGFQDRDYRRLLDQFDLSHEEVRAAAAADKLAEVAKA